MQIGQEKTGMITMNQSLKGFYDKGILDRDACMGMSSVPEELEKMLGASKEEDNLDVNVSLGRSR